jgi:4-amino-4-deoxy-L-arabinose transferase-like glycosyltransferase
MKLPFFILLSAVILLGGILRFYNVSNNPPGLYLDEVSIGLNAYDILKTGKDQYGFSYPLTFKSFGDYKMPVYIYLVSLSMIFFGKTDLAVRFPSALAGTLTVLVVFLLIRELLKNDKQTKSLANVVALVGSLVFAILPWHLQFSRGGFEVCVAVFFYGLGLFLGLRFWNTKKWLYLLGVVLCLCISEYTYQAYRVISPLTFLLITMVLFFKDKKLFKNFLTAFFIFIVISFPLIAFSFTPQGQERLLGTSAFSRGIFSAGIIGFTKDIIIFLNNYLSYFSLTFLFHLGDQINRHQVQDFGLLYFWQLPFLVAGFYFLTKTKNTLLRFMTIFLLLIYPVAPAIALPSPQTLRSLLATIPLTILTALGIYQIYIQRNKLTKLLFVITTIFALVSFVYFLDYYFIQYPKESLIDWGAECKLITSQIKQESNKYSHIVIDKNLGCIPEYFSFYIPSIPLEYANPSWEKPAAWNNQKVLYVRPFYGKAKPDKLEENIYLTNINHDIFAQFYNL